MAEHLRPRLGGPHLAPHGHDRHLDPDHGGRYNNEGRPTGGSGFFGAYAPGPARFNQLLEDWRPPATYPVWNWSGRPGDRPPDDAAADRY